MEPQVEWQGTKETEVGSGLPVCLIGDAGTYSNVEDIEPAKCDQVAGAAGALQEVA